MVCNYQQLCLWFVIINSCVYHKVNNEYIKAHRVHILAVRLFLMIPNDISMALHAKPVNRSHYIKIDRPELATMHSVSAK